MTMFEEARGPNVRVLRQCRRSQTGRAAGTPSSTAARSEPSRDGSMATWRPTSRWVTCLDRCERLRLSGPSSSSWSAPTSRLEGPPDAGSLERS
jgi:hypothetical protein